jgi:hypothetical protein
VDAFGYVSVVLSVIIGLGISHLLGGVVDLLKSRQRVRFFWLHALWMAQTFVGHVFLWWTMWNLRLLAEWNFIVFLLILLPPVLLYVSASLLVPKVEPTGAIDLRQAFEENRTPFYAVMAAFHVLMPVENWMFSGHLALAPTLIFAVWFVLLCLAAYVKDTRFDAAIGISFALLFLVFVLQFGLRLGRG